MGTGNCFCKWAEINTKMDGEPVGQGWVTLWQIRISKNLFYQKNNL